MLTKTVSKNGVRFTVHTETGRHSSIKRQLYARVYNPALGEDDPDFGLWTDFIDAFVQSTDVEVPFEWPSMTLNIETLLPVRDNWLNLPSDVYRAWKEAIIEVEPVGDEDLLPAADLPKEDATILTSPVNDLNSVPA